MKEIKLLHMYYDILNMYGENGNMRSLVKSLEKQGIVVKLDFKSIDDKIDINKYDLIYMGTGLDESYPLVLNDFKKYKSDITKFINDNKMIIATGNSLNMFSDLEILNFKSKQIDFRIIGEQIYNCKLINKKVIGFQNRDCVITDNKEDYLFDVVSGCGYEPNNLKEGVRKNNFFGTYLLGPLLIRNPYFRDYLVKLLLGSDYKILDKDIDYTAYSEFLKNFVNE